MATQSRRHMLGGNSSFFVPWFETHRSSAMCGEPAAHTPCAQWQNIQRRPRFVKRSVQCVEGGGWEQGDGLFQIAFRLVPCGGAAQAFIQFDLGAVSQVLLRFADVGAPQLVNPVPPVTRGFIPYSFFASNSRETVFKQMPRARLSACVQVWQLPYTMPALFASILPLREKECKYVSTATNARSGFPIIGKD